MSGYDVRIEKQRSGGNPGQAAGTRGHDPARAERARTVIVLGLTLACTCMAFLDLLLLASSS
jgi:hypothetical protein